VVHFGRPHGGRNMKLHQVPARRWGSNHLVTPRNTCKATPGRTAHRPEASLERRLPPGRLPEPDGFLPLERPLKGAGLGHRIVVR